MITRCFFSFEVTENVVLSTNDIVTIELFNISPYYNLDLYLYDSEGELILGSCNSNNLLEEIDILAYIGIYIIEVRNLDSLSHASFDLSISGLDYYDNTNLSNGDSLYFDGESIYMQEYPELSGTMHVYYIPINLIYDEINNQYITFKDKLSNDGSAVLTLERGIGLGTTGVGLVVSFINPITGSVITVGGLITTLGSMALDGIEQQHKDLLESILLLKDTSTYIRISVLEVDSSYIDSYFLLSSGGVYDFNLIEANIDLNSGQYYPYTTYVVHEIDFSSVFIELYRNL